MNYKIEPVSFITKLTIPIINDIVSNGVNEKSGLNTLFWNHIFDKNTLEDFINNKYYKFQKKRLDKINYNLFIEESNFIMKKLDQVKQNINLLDQHHVPSGQDVFFSYRIFNTILGYYNDYYKESDIFLSLSNALIFGKKSLNTKEFISNIDFYKESNFIEEVITPLLQSYISNKGNNTIFQIGIFWPDELISISIFASIIKKQLPGAKIIVDFSKGNEQFDFTQWVEMIKDSGNKFFKYIDYFLVSRDFGKSTTKLINLLNNNQSFNDLNNIIYYDNHVKFKDIDTSQSDKEMFETFEKSNFNKNAIGILFGEKIFSGRLVPYKCYWNNCSFCAINSHNKFTLNENYSYHYYIKRWVKFIKENNIKYVSIIDEAIPPLAIVFFAKLIIKENIKIKYFFRTRFEIQYTKENIRILQQSGAGFCGMGLESAVDRINEVIGNKGNSSVDIIEKMRKIHYMDKVGVSIHNYSIMGFPGETEEEYTKTYNFLKQNIIKSQQYTCSPNIFNLMKGPKIFQEMDKYGITVRKEDLDNPFILSYDFKHNGESRNIGLLQKLVNDLHRIQFTPWLDYTNNAIDFSDFWAYIDRSGIFYIMKQVYRKNPYYLYKNINNSILKEKFDTILKEKFNISQYFQIIDKEDKIDVYDRCLCGHILMPKYYKSFLLNYSNNKNLLENIQILDNDNTINLKYFILLLIENRILLHVN